MGGGSDRSSPPPVLLACPNDAREYAGSDQHRHDAHSFNQAFVDHLHSTPSAWLHSSVLPGAGCTKGSVAQAANNSAAARVIAVAMLRIVNSFRGYSRNQRRRVTAAREKPGQSAGPPRRHHRFDGQRRNDCPRAQREQCLSTRCPLRPAHSAGLKSRRPRP